MTTILLTACEPSGDALGAALMTALSAARSDLRFIGGGGKEMIAAGLRDPLPTDQLAVMGVGDALSAWPHARSLSRRIGALAAAEKPDVAIFVDAWGFSKMAAERVRRSSPETRRIKLAVPQVWASRPHRAKAAAGLFDHLLCLLPFEPPYFEAVGGDALFIGNPNFQKANAQSRSGKAFRERHDLGEQPVLLMLPGSRSREVNTLLPVFGEVANQLALYHRDLVTVVIAGASVADEVRAGVATWKHSVRIVGSDERFDAFDAGDVALAASGTVATELAVAGTPMVVTYKVGPLTAFVANKLLITPFVTVLNIAAGEEVVPERLQEECNPARLADDVAQLLTNPKARDQQKAAFRRLLPGLLGEGDAAERAASFVLDLCSRANNPGSAKRGR